MVLVGFVAAIADLIYPDDRKSENLFWTVFWCCTVAPGVMLLARYMLWLDGGSTTEWSSLILAIIALSVLGMIGRSLVNAVLLHRRCSARDRPKLWLKPLVWTVYALSLPVFVTDLNRPPYKGGLTAEANVVINWLDDYRNVLETAALASSTLLCACTSVVLLMFLFWPERTSSMG